MNNEHLASISAQLILKLYREDVAKMVLVHSDTWSNTTPPYSEEQDQFTLLHANKAASLWITHIKPN